MMKKCLFAVALLSLALAGGCAKGGNGESALIAVDTEITTPVNGNSNAIYPTQTLTLTATVTPAGTNPAVTWSLSGPGTLTPVTPATTPATAVYVAPTTAGTPATVTATSVANTQATGPIVLNIVDITTEVTPTAPNIGNGLTQQFTAIASPDDAPQTFTWTCTANGNPCANFSQDPNISGLAYYKATDNCSGSCVQVKAITPLDTNGCATSKYCTIGKPSLVTSRVSGTYAFQFSGYDSSNNPVAVTGTFVATNGTITSGAEDEQTSNGINAHAITGGSYNPITASDPNSNNAGVLTLTLPAGIYPNKFQAVLGGAGNIEMIETDGHGTGSGIAQLSTGSSGFKGDQTYAFGFTGVDSSGKRVGLAGVLPMNGGGAIAGGQMDVNDNGNTSDICASPCSVTGSYTGVGQPVGTMILTSGSLTLHFDFFVASGLGNSKTTPLTFYAISTDPVDATHPAVSGTMVLQDSSQTYNIAAFKGTSVSALTGTGPNGANTNVSLTLGTTDGNGNFSGQFDQNNAGTILSYPSSTQSNFAYTYAASGSTNGRYTFNLLGNPGTSPAVAPLPFVLYASGVNRGFLLDQSSASVMTGTMNPQGKGSGVFSASELPGTFAAATTGGGDPAAVLFAANLLLTSPGNAVFNVSGTEYQNLGSAAVTGTYTMNVTGTGTIPLTVPSTQTYVIYAVDTTGCSGSNPVCTILDFFMIDVDKTSTDPAVIFAQQ